MLKTVGWKSTKPLKVIGIDAWCRHCSGGSNESLVAARSASEILYASGRRDHNGNVGVAVTVVVE